MWTTSKRTESISLTIYTASVSILLIRTYASCTRLMFEETVVTRSQRQKYANEIIPIRTALLVLGTFSKSQNVACMQRIWPKAWTNYTRTQHQTLSSNSICRPSFRWHAAYQPPPIYFRRVAMAVSPPQTAIRTNRCECLHRSRTNERHIVKNVNYKMPIINHCRETGHGIAYTMAVHSNKPKAFWWTVANRRMNCSWNSAKRLANDPNQRTFISSIRYRTMMSAAMMCLSCKITQPYGRIVEIPTTLKRPHKNPLTFTIPINRWTIRATMPINRMPQRIYSMQTRLAVAASTHFWITPMITICGEAEVIHVTRICIQAERCPRILWSEALLMMWMIWPHAVYRPMVFIHRTIWAWHYRRRMQRLYWRRHNRQTLPPTTIKSLSMHWPIGTVDSVMQIPEMRTPCRFNGQRLYQAHHALAMLPSTRRVHSEKPHKCPHSIHSTFREWWNRQPAIDSMIPTMRIRTYVIAAKSWSMTVCWWMRMIRSIHSIWIDWNANEGNHMLACLRLMLILVMEHRFKADILHLYVYFVCVSVYLLQSSNLHGNFCQTVTRFIV